MRGDAPDPVAGPGQVVVEVAFASITFVETQMRACLPGPFKPDLPVIPGNGVGGVVAGRRVVSSTGGSGGYAERAAVDAGGMFDVPDGLALARELGASIAVDYRAAGWTDGVGQVDVVFDGVGGAIGRAAFELLRRGGRMLSYGLASGEWTSIPDDEAAARGVALVRPARPTPAEQRDLTQSALAAAAAGRLRPVIGQRFPLERAAEAHATIESRATIGKTLLDVR